MLLDLAGIQITVAGYLCILSHDITYLASRRKRERVTLLSLPRGGREKVQRISKKNVTLLYRYSQTKKISRFIFNTIKKLEKNKCCIKLTRVQKNQKDET